MQRQIAKPFYERKVKIVDTYECPTGKFSFSADKTLDLDYVKEAKDLIQSCTPCLTTKYTLLKRYQKEDLWARSARGSNFPTEDLFPVLFSDFIVTVLNSKLASGVCLLKDAIPMSVPVIMNGTSTAVSVFTNNFIKVVKDSTKIVKYFGLQYEVLNKPRIAEIKDWFEDFMKEAANCRHSGLVPVTQELIVVEMLYNLVLFLKSFFTQPIGGSVSTIVNATPVEVPKFLDTSLASKDFIKTVLLSDLYWSILEETAKVGDVKLSDIITGNVKDGFQVDSAFYDKAFDILVESGISSFLPAIKMTQNFETKWRLTQNRIEDAVFLSTATKTDVIPPVRKLLWMVDLNISRKGQIDEVQREYEFYCSKTDSFIAKLTDIVDRFYTETQQIYHDWFDAFGTFHGPLPKLDRLERRDLVSDPVVAYKLLKNQDRVLDIELLPNVYREQRQNFFIMEGYSKDILRRQPDTCAEVAFDVNNPGMLTFGDWSKARERMKKACTVVSAIFEPETFEFSAEEVVSCYTINRPVQGPPHIAMGDGCVADTDIFTISKIDPDNCTVNQLLLGFRYGDVASADQKRLEELYDTRMNHFLKDFEDTPVLERTYAKLLKVRKLSPLFALFLMNSGDPKIEAMATDDTCILLPSKVTMGEINSKRLPKWLTSERYLTIVLQCPLKIFDPKTRASLIRDGEYIGPRNVDGSAIFKLKLLPTSLSTMSSDLADLVEVTVCLDLWLNVSYKAGVARRIQDRNSSSYKVMIPLMFGDTNFHFDLKTHDVILVDSTGVLPYYRYFNDYSFFDPKKYLLDNAFAFLKEQLKSYFIVSKGFFRFLGNNPLIEYALEESCIQLYNYLRSHWSTDVTMYDLGVASDMSLHDFLIALQSYDYEALLTTLCHCTVQQLCYTEFIPRRLTSFGDFYLMADILADRVHPMGDLSCTETIQTLDFGKHIDGAYQQAFAAFLAKVVDYALIRQVKVTLPSGSDEFTFTEGNLVFESPSSEVNEHSQDTSLDLSFSVVKPNDGTPKKDKGKSDKKQTRIITVHRWEDGAITSSFNIQKEDLDDFLEKNPDIYIFAFRDGLAYRANTKKNREVFVNKEVFEQLLNYRNN